MKYSEIILGGWGADEGRRGREVLE